MGKIKDLTGQRFGRLLVLERAEDHIYPSGKHRIKWRCQCDCGGYKETTVSKLQEGSVTSCGCLISRGEYFVSQYLDNKNIRYKRQYSFQDLRGIHGGLLRFDFGVLDENENLLFLIEYQGSQHYQDDGKFGKQERESTDELKREYCQKNKIALYEIRYDEDINESMNNILCNENLQ